MKLERMLRFFLKIFLLVLPWQTVWIISERSLHGVKWQYGTLQLFASEIVLWVCVVLGTLWYHRAIKKKTMPVRVRPSADRMFVAGFFVLMLYVYASSLWSVDPAITRQHALYLMEAFFVFFMIAFGPLSLKESITFFAYGSVIPGLLGVVQFVAQFSFASTFLGLAPHDPLIPGTSILETASVPRLLRAYGTFGHPNMFGGYVLFVLISIAILYIYPKKEKPEKKWLLRCLSILNIGALFFTFSRSALLGFLVFGVGLFACMLLRKNQEGRSLAVDFFVKTKELLLWGIVLFLLLFAYRGIVFGRIAVENTHERASVEERMVGYGEAEQLFWERPVFGTGAGTYTKALFLANPERPEWEYQPVHNVFLLMLVELGMAGVVLVVAVIGLYVHFAKDVIVKHTGLVALVALSLLPIVLFDHYIWSLYGGILLVGVMGGFITRFMWKELT